ncbi:MAG TPA: hypoxanthine phosphoribosyltransferase [Gammaproteobacteria bacterium]|jgi:hypoxanthine phosphoribosyltransferase|nr:hypoxanthine phosphoribosyltransferase [Gammaproteobacteria bacterium]|tara:strand:- start:547 stop:1098 length:552 start_codon:yes stop_codon:yes gene_type:complete
MKMNKYQKNVIVSEERIQQEVKKLAAKLNEKYKGKSIVALGLLKGAFVFMADIIRQLNIDVQVEFLIVKSYKNCQTSGKPKILLDLKRGISNQNIVIFEDIIDTGRTIAAVKDYLSYKGAKQVEVVALLTKPSRREVFVDVDYELFTIPNEIVVGYGLDYNEYGRHLPDIIALNDAALEELKE